MRFLFYFLLFLPFFSQSDTAFQLPFSQSGRASIEEDLSQLINPATLGFHKRSKSAIAYSFQGKNQKLSVAFTDVKNFIPMSFFYERSWSEKGFISGDWNRVSVAVASPLNQAISLGLNAYRDSLKNKEEEDQNLWNGDFGMLLRLPSHTGFSLNLDHILIYEDNNERLLHIGIYQDIKNILSLRGDATYQFQHSDWILRGSVSFSFKRFLAIHIGHSWDKKEMKQRSSLGLGFLGPRLQLDYAVNIDGIFNQNLAQDSSSPQNFSLEHVVIAKMVF